MFQAIQYLKLLRPSNTQSLPSKLDFVCVCVCLLLQDLLQSCSRGGEEESGGHVL